MVTAAGLLLIMTCGISSYAIPSKTGRQSRLGTAPAGGACGRRRRVTTPRKASGWGGGSRCGRVPPEPAARDCGA